MIKKTLIAAICVLSAATFAESANADYQVSEIVNSTRLTLNFELRWGNGSWKRCTVEPGGTMETWNNTRGGLKRLEIRFDGDPGPGVDPVCVRLRTLRSPTTILNGPPTDALRILNNGRIVIRQVR